MIDIELVNDPEKAASNLVKHAISFEEASSVFLGDLSACTYFDVDHLDEDENHLHDGNLTQWRIPLYRP